LFKRIGFFQNILIGDYDKKCLTLSKENQKSPFKHIRFGRSKSQVKGLMQVCCRIPVTIEMRIYFVLISFFFLEMGKTKRLTDAEIQIIKSFNKQGDSNRQIASKIGRSETVIRNLLKKVINMELKKNKRKYEAHSTLDCVMLDRFMKNLNYP
jgi:hypothetical protein